jgi:hypothetical protein
MARRPAGAVANSYHENGVGLHSIIDDERPNSQGVNLQVPLTTTPCDPESLRHRLKPIDFIQQSLANQSGYLR